MKEKYKHSGKVPPLGIILGLLIGLVSSVPLAYLYDLGIINVPYIKLRMIFTLLFGLLVGIASGWGLTLGKVRNTGMAVILGALVSAAGLYISWGAWLLTVFEKPYTRLFVLLGHPDVMRQMLLYVNANGTWSMSGSATTGIELWILWTMEALGVIVCGVAGSFAMMRRQPFCESCDRWCSKAGQLPLVPTMGPAELMAKVNQGQFDFLKNAVRASRKEARYILEWHSCATCANLNTLSVTQVFPRNNKNLGRQLLLSAAEAEALKNWQMANAV